MNLKKILGFLAVGGLLVVAAPNQPAQAASLINPGIAAIIQWGNEFNPSPFGLASIVVDAQNDDPLELEFVGASRTGVPTDDVKFLPGPASVVQW